MEVEAQIRRPNTRGGTSTRGPQKPTGKSILNSQKLFVGGDVAASFNNNFTYIVIAPLLGYRITERASIAAGPSFQYSSRPLFNANPVNGFDCESKKSVWGARTMGRYDIVQGLFAHVEFDAYNFQKCTRLPKQFGKAKTWIYRLPIGGGYSQRLVGNTFANFYVLYDVLYDEDTSPFNSPFIYNGGITVRL